MFLSFSILCHFCYTIVFHCFLSSLRKNFNCFTLWRPMCVTLMCVGATLFSPRTCRLHPCAPRPPTTRGFHKPLVCSAACLPDRVESPRGSPTARSTTELLPQPGGPRQCGPPLGFSTISLSMFPPCLYCIFHVVSAVLQTKIPTIFPSLRSLTKFPNGVSHRVSIVIPIEFVTFSHSVCHGDVPPCEYHSSQWFTLGFPTSFTPCFPTIFTPCFPYCVSPTGFPYCVSQRVSKRVSHMSFQLWPHNVSNVCPLCFPMMFPNESLTQCSSSVVPPSFLFMPCFPQCLPPCLPTEFPPCPTAFPSVHPSAFPILRFPHFASKNVSPSCFPLSLPCFQTCFPQFCCFVSQRVSHRWWFHNRSSVETQVRPWFQRCSTVAQQCFFVVSTVSAVCPLCFPPC